MTSDDESTGTFSEDNNRRPSVSSVTSAVASVASAVPPTEEHTDLVITSRGRGVAANNLVIPSTYQLVEDGTHNYPHIISWTKEGDGFEVKDIEALESSVLGVKFFGTSKYASFRRQLNKYQFIRSHRQSIRKDVPVARVDVFRHKFFQRGRPDLLSKITRQSANGSGKFKSTEEVKALKTRLADLEDVQSELRKTMRRLENSNTEHMTLIGLLQRQDTDKDRTIRGLEARLRTMEERLSSVQAAPPSKTASALLPTRSESNDLFSLIRGTSVVGLGPARWWKQGDAAAPASGTLSRQQPALAVPRAVETSSPSPSPPATLPPHPKKRGGSFIAQQQQQATKDTDVAMTDNRVDPLFRLDSMTWLKGNFFPCDGNGL